MTTAANLKGEGLKRIDIVWTWVERRVLPLQARGALMCYYHGPSNPSRVSLEELEEKETRHWLTLLAGLEAEKISLEVAVEPFCQDAPPGEVAFFSWFLFLGNWGRALFQLPSLAL